MRFAVIAVLSFAPLLAQDIKIPPSLEKLAERAAEVVDVTMDSSLLQLAARFLPEKDPDTARIKRLITGLKGIYVRSFEFDSAGEYQESDVEAIRSQLRGPGWSRIVGVRSRKHGENSEVFLKSDGANIVGLAIVAAEPRELTIVNISGPIRPEDLQELGGHFGIPKMDSGGMRKNNDKKDEE